MNPVDQTLNEILVGIGQAPRPFPTLDNQSIPFLREREHNTKIRAVQPVFQPALYYNYKIKNNLQQIIAKEVAVYTRQLMQDVKKASFLENIDRVITSGVSYPDKHSKIEIIP
ncbi:MAG TPA: hypothetical protein EYP36_04805 [Calditrichaeota bacterium]|nr:hypothetical protein [Calditrichota bacterium]